MSDPNTTGGCFTFRDGQTVCIDPLMCDPIAVKVCDANGCRCEVPPPTLAGCVATVTFAPGAPAAPTLTTAGPCDAASLELALAVLLARLLGAPR